MKTIRILIALLALTPSLAFAHGWGRYRRWDRRDYVVVEERYAPRRVVYVEAPRPVIVVRPRPNPVAVGVAAGLVTGLVIASLVHGR
jgi:hypothetical protein